MLVNSFEKVVTLLLKGFFLVAFRLLVRLLGPTSFKKPSHVLKLDLFSFPLKCRVHLSVHDLLDLGYYKLTLRLDGLRDVLIVDGFVDLALHHG